MPLTVDGPPENCIVQGITRFLYHVAMPTAAGSAQEVHIALDVCAGDATATVALTSADAEAERGVALTPGSPSVSTQLGAYVGVAPRTSDAVYQLRAVLGKGTLTASRTLRVLATSAGIEVSWAPVVTSSGRLAGPVRYDLFWGDAQLVRASFATACGCYYAVGATGRAKMVSVPADTPRATLPRDVDFRGVLVQVVAADVERRELFVYAASMPAALDATGETPVVPVPPREGHSVFSAMMLVAVFCVCFRTRAGSLLRDRVLTTLQACCQRKGPGSRSPSYGSGWASTFGRRQNQYRNITPMDPRRIGSGSYVPPTLSI